VKKAFDVKRDKCQARNEKERKKAARVKSEYRVPGGMVFPCLVCMLG
jgi:hypothetical protein